VSHPRHQDEDDEDDEDHGQAADDRRIVQVHGLPATARLVRDMPARVGEVHFDER
jgi:hypothetical protein